MKRLGMNGNGNARENGCGAWSGRPSFLLALVSFLCFATLPAQVKGFDVRNHLSSLTRYEDSVNLQNGDLGVEKLDFVPPEGCTPIHLNLLARHGTRGPTAKRMRELENLVKKLRSEYIRIQTVSENETPETDSSKDMKSGRKSKVPSWMKNFRSPWEKNFKGGELLPEGEEELFQLGLRIRKTFKQIFSEDYHSKLYSIYATQVARASASAVAFGMGLFYGNGSLGAGNHRAFAVVTETKAHDRHLRFHDTCPAYVVRKEKAEVYTRSKKEALLSRINMDLKSNFDLNLTNAEVLSLWLLCKLEASLLRLTHRSCDLFSAEDVVLLEWMDDLEVYHVKGYGAAINYRMGVPLLNDVVESMENAVSGWRSGLKPECSEWRQSKLNVNEQDESMNTRVNNNEGESDKVKEIENSIKDRERGEVDEEDEDENEDEEQGESIDDKKEATKKWCNDNATHQRARLRFAHAETIVPFICLLGLFQEKSPSLAQKLQVNIEENAHTQQDSKSAQENQKILEDVLDLLDLVRLELPLPPPPMPPASRVWRVSYVAPFAANTALVLYHCPNSTSPSTSSGDDNMEGLNGRKKNDSSVSEFMVLAYHNERLVVLPACGSLFCPFETFKEKVANPHLKHSFEATCDIDVNDVQTSTNLDED